MPNPGAPADQLELVQGVARARAALQEAAAANPSWGSWAPVTLPADLDAAVAAAKVWLESVALPWCAGLDGLPATLPPIREPGTS